MISTHILDTSLGHPASGVRVILEKLVGENWSLIGTEVTNRDGRISFTCSAESGTYRLQFHTAEYFAGHKITGFFPIVPVTFHVGDSSRKYHIPLLLSPYGYTTYRGS